MKYAKMLGLAAMAAAAMTAVVGPGSASATVLCKEWVLICPVAKIYPVGTTLAASQNAATTMTFKNGGTTVSSCTGSSWSALVSNKGGAGIPVSGSNETLSFTGCSTAVAVTAKGQFAIHHIPGNTEGALTFLGTQLTVTVAGQDCVYALAGEVASLGSGKFIQSPSVVGEAVPIGYASGPGTCPAVLEWDFTSTFTAPKPLWFKAE